MQIQISREEFYRSISDLKADLKEDLAGIQQRLDQLNMRTGKGEVADATLQARVTSVEKEVFDHPNRRQVDRVGQGEVWASAFTRRERTMIALGLFLVAGVLRAIELLGTKLWEVLMTHHP